MECEELYDAPNNLGPSEQELPLEDFGDCELKSKPYVGMQFDSLDDIETFYKEFCKKESFGIHVHTSKKALRSDNVTSRIYECCSEGQRKTKNALDNGLSKDDENKARTGCEAILRVMKNKKLQEWVVKGFGNNHNYGIISPKRMSYLRCHKKMSTAAKSLFENFGEEGLPTGKVVMMFNVGDQTFTSRDFWNHLRDVRGENIDAGDTLTVLNYCQKQQAQNSNFFYAIQCDDAGHMVHFFWVDARSRMAYQYFEDVVTFDTTYKTNKYHMPFAPFTGLNHHCQSILFGCALL
ncbi:protein FAR1-RELATED SEQUENCE 5-like [Castanea sativa]|uniref:protein FAR1-RELATED SEQUENCE 5-like n=1 Tax=Castanea sativa TaxID=21020 RepID=UPI003F64CF99